MGVNEGERQTVISEALEAVVVDDLAGGHVVEVTIARPGVSQNGYIYSESVLREGASLWDGAPAFLDHPTALDLTRAGSRSLRDLVGVYEGARFEPGRGIRAKLRLSPNDQGVFATIRESIVARSAGRVAAPVGISADWRLLHSAAKGEGGRDLREVQRVVAVNSGDLVIRPSAGGSFDRILEGVRWQVGEAGTALATPVGGPGSGMFPSEEVRNGGSTSVQPAQTGEAPGGGAVYGVEGVVERAVAEALAPVRRQFAQAQLETRLATSGLPVSAQGLVRQQFTGRVFEAAELDIAIGAFKGMLGEVFGQSSIRGVGHNILDAGSVQGTTPMEKMQVAFDRLFGLEVDASMTGVPRLTGIREGYILLTGDKFFSGKYNWEESVVREANEVTTSILANVVLNSMTKRLVKDYQAQPKWSTYIPESFHGGSCPRYSRFLWRPTVLIPIRCDCVVEWRSVGATAQ
jgi:hypothetical protein